jgi:hypothetical protein
MANGTGNGGGSVSTTAAVALPVGAGLIVATWLVHPTWPPSQEVLTVVVTAAAPMFHLIYRGIYRWLTGWVGDDPAQPGDLVAIPQGAPAVAVAVVPPAQPPPPVQPAPAPPPAAPAQPQGQNP